MKRSMIVSLIVFAAVIIHRANASGMGASNGGQEILVAGEGIGEDWVVRDMFKMNEPITSSDIESSIKEAGKIAIQNAIRKCDYEGGSITDPIGQWGFRGENPVPTSYMEIEACKISEARFRMGANGVLIVRCHAKATLHCRLPQNP